MDDIQIGGRWYHPRERFTSKRAAQAYAATLKRKGYHLQGDFYPPGTGSVRVIKRGKYWVVWTGE